MRLGNREFDTTLNGERLSVHEARCIVLDLVLQMEPKVATDLLRRRSLSVKSANPHPKEIDRMIDLYFAIMLPEIGLNESISILNRDCSFQVEASQLDAPLPHFCDLLVRKKPNIDRAVKAQIRKRRLPINDPSVELELARNTAIKDLVTKGAGWDNQPSSQVAISLLSWGQTWNLTEPWCLDFGLDVLMEFVRELGKVPMDFRTNAYMASKYADMIEHLEISTWKSTILHQRLENNFAASDHPLRFEFHFDWKPSKDRYQSQSFSIKEIYSPTEETDARFKVRAAEALWFGFLGHFRYRGYHTIEKFDEVKVNFNRFRKELTSFVTRSRKDGVSVSERSSIKREGDRDFRWFVEYQVLEKKYAEIAEESEASAHQIGRAVKRIADLVRCKLRKGGKGGRTPGITEKYPRRRVRSKGK